MTLETSYVNHGWWSEKEFEEVVKVLDRIDKMLSPIGFNVPGFFDSDLYWAIKTCEVQEIPLLLALSDADFGSAMGRVFGSAGKRALS